MKHFVRICVLALLFAATISQFLVKGESLRLPTNPATDTVEVRIDNFSFGPQSITVAAGSTVKWTNRDDIPHTVVSTDGVFKSRVLDTDKSFSFTFSKPGKYSYFCSVHPKMTGTVVVQ